MSFTLPGLNSEGAEDMEGRAWADKINRVFGVDWRVAAGVIILSGATALTGGVIFLQRMLGV